MDVLPAIDLIGGEVVRLERGDYGKKTVYDPNPVSVAKRFEAAGASWVHVIDLEGARDGRPRHFDVLRRIRDEAGLLIEYGGGVRDAKTFTEAMQAGANRIIAGTAALSEPEKFFGSLPDGGREIVLIGADMRDGTLRIKGWEAASAMTLEQVVDFITSAGVGGLFFTDTGRDGTLAGVDDSMLGRVLSLCGDRKIPCFVAGGVRDLDDIRRLRAMPHPPAGVIAGKAIYEKTLDLRAALEVVS